MKNAIIILVLSIFAITGLSAQNINFNSYKKVTDADFKRFLSLFAEKQLPLLCDELVQTVNIWKLKQPSVPKEFVDKYLVEAGEYITGPLYTNMPADGLPGKVVYGVLYPLYKLPTNGDYVLLVLAQVDDEKECEAQVIALTFDLAGTLIYFSNYTYLPGSEYYNGYIDTNLISHHEHIIIRSNGELVVPPKNEVFTALGVHTSYQINSDGKSTKLNTEKAEAQFKFSHSECRFKKMN
jgi:hypothetical protein